MKRKRRVLFLQLPQIDNDVSAAHENLHLAAAYLAYAAERAGEQAHYALGDTPPALEQCDDRRLAQLIVAQRPDVIVATLYLWNIERTLRVLERIRARLPAVNPTSRIRRKV
jgi:hypothetical protein